MDSDVSHIQIEGLEDVVTIVHAGNSSRNGHWKKQEAIRNRTLLDIITFAKQLTQRRDELTVKLISFAEAPVSRVLPCICTDQSSNMKLRIHAFVERELSNANIWLVNKQLSEVVTKIDQVKRVSELVRRESLIVTVKDEFYLVKKVNDFRTLALMAFLGANEVKPEVIDFGWLFHSTIRTAMVGRDKAMTYSKPVDSEVDISRVVFCGESRKMANEIDRIVEGDAACFVGEMGVFVREVIERNALNEEEKETGSLILMRLLFDRLYERCSVFKDDHQGDQFMELARMPLPFFVMPNGVKLENNVKSIRETFAKDEKLREAMLTIDNMMFMTSPMDIVYIVHQSMLTAQHVYLKHINDGESHVMCFDDIFAITVGVILASDVPNYFAISDFCEQYAPNMGALEHGKATMVALSMHLKALSLGA